jgi:hypothetical protein
VPNIAEGAGEFSPRDKARFYRIARRSATESAAILDVIEQRQNAPADKLASAQQLLVEIVSMLVRMIAIRARAGARARARQPHWGVSRDVTMHVTIRPACNAPAWCDAETRSFPRSPPRPAACNCPVVPPARFGRRLLRIERGYRT